MSWNGTALSLILYTLQQFIHKGRGPRKPHSAEVKHKHTLKHTDTHIETYGCQ